MFEHQRELVKYEKIPKSELASKGGCAYNYTIMTIDDDTIADMEWHFKKVNEKLHNKITLGVYDLFRFSMQTTDIKKISTALETLQKNFEVIRIKNKMNSVLHQILVNFKFEDVVCEAQFSYA